MATGTVKFFNPAKGFGFIAPDDGGQDVFVHVSAIQNSRLSALNEGDQVSYEIEVDRRSGKVTAVDLELLQAAEPGARSSRAAHTSGGFQQNRGFSGGRARASVGEGAGVVKWFNTQKGFGFIQPNDGGGDVFVHISAVERAGLRSLSDGQAIAYDLEEDRRSGKLSATNLRFE